MQDDPAQPLGNPKYEQFAQLIAAGAGSDAAYEQVGYSPSRDNAKALRRRLRPRIDYLRARTAERVSEKVADNVVQFARPAEQAQAIAVTKEFISSALLENALICMGQKLITLKVWSKSADKVIDVEVNDRNAHAANKALELLGKTVGSFNEKAVSSEERAHAAPIKTMDDDAAYVMLQAYRDRREARRKQAEQDAAQNG